MSEEPYDEVEEWGEEESESELPIMAFAPYEEFILPVSILAGSGSVLTGLGIAQVLNKGAAQMLQKTLPLLTAKVSILSFSVPIVSLVGVGLIGFAMLLIVKAREVVIKL